MKLPAVEAVACGQSHTIALTRKGDLFGWGMNTFGQTGIKPRNYPVVLRPKEVPTEYDLQIKQVKLQCGRHHSVMYASKSFNILIMIFSYYSKKRCNLQSFYRV